jgi:hypothetical protein
MWRLSTDPVAESLMLAAVYELKLVSRPVLPWIFATALLATFSLI